jgi:hypothetical protein
MQHKHEFAPGDRVEWHAAPANARRDGYKILQLLPENAQGELQYRIRSDGEQTDRIVTETQLASRPRSTTFNA